MDILTDTIEWWFTRVTTVREYRCYMYTKDKFLWLSIETDRDDDGYFNEIYSLRWGLKEDYPPTPENNNRWVDHFDSTIKWYETL